jgi:hypothetical protein
MRRVRIFSALSSVFFLILALDAHQQPSRASQGSTCDESAIDPESYKLATEAQALNVLRPRDRWWEPTASGRTLARSGT